jgi:Flp pilus assembly protein TadG
MIVQSGLGVPRRRPGATLPVVALCLVALIGFLALAIDLGLLAIAKTQAQNAADMAALTAARTLNGSSTTSSPNNGAYNNIAATTNAQNVGTYNKILGQSIQSSQLTLTYGSYDYNQTTQAFSANYPPTSNVPWTAVTATVTSGSVPGAFSKVFGFPLLSSVTATAQAVHRPRDVALTIDYSGSMLYASCLGFDPISWTRTTNNPDPLVPTFGAYSSTSAVMKGPSTNRTSATDSYTIAPSNATVTNSSYSSTYINSFFQNNAYATTLVRAFDSYTSSDGGNTWTAPSGTATPQLPPSSYATTPGGDVPLFKFGSTSTYAQTVNDVLGTSSTNTAANMMWELDGYSAYAGGKPDTSGTGGVPQVWLQADYSAPASPPQNGSLPFNGYTQGPGYYGKTFFLWPPDPRNMNALSGSTLTGYLNALGITNSTDQATLSGIWSTWQTQGAAGLTNLQNWLKGTAKGGASSLPKISGGNYSNTKVTGVTSWNGKALAAANEPSTYFAMCRLFNRAYPNGAAWTSTSHSADWRVRFFGINNNSVLFKSQNGDWGALAPPGSTGMQSALQTYYDILQWINSAPNPFPAQLRAGRIKYYGSIPNSYPAFTGSWPSWGNTDQQFWQQIIDNALGFMQFSSQGTYWDLSGLGSTGSLIGYGSDFAWGTVSIASSNNPPAPSPATAPQAYMNYTDNPGRPLLRFWFGPLLMTDYFHNNNYTSTNMSGYYYMQPGDCYDAPSYVTKEAYLAAVNLMQNNHPNDWFTVVPYSQCRGSSTSTTGRNNCVSVPLGINYSYASAALLFPFSTINADGSCNNTEVTPFDADPATGLVPSANFADVPRSFNGTSFAMALLLIHNQFAATPTSDTTLRSFVSSSPINFPTGMAGGLGRKGAQKLVIFETDGMPNVQASATLTTNGSYTYYPIQYDMNKPTSSNYPTGNNYTAVNDPTTLSQIYGYVSTLSSTYGTTRNPFRLYGIGFGPVFSGADASSAQSTLVAMQNAANGTSITSLPSSQIITGTDTQMSANLVSAFTNILENSVQITLIK